MVLAGEAFAASAVAERFTGGGPIVNRLTREVHSFHVDIADDPGEGPPPVSADVIVDLRLHNSASPSLVYRLNLDNQFGTLTLSQGGELGMVASGTLTPGSTVSGRLVYDVPGPEPSFPSVLEAHLGGRDGYVLLGWQFPID